MLLCCLNPQVESLCVIDSIIIESKIIIFVFFYFINYFFKQLQAAQVLPAQTAAHPMMTPPAAMDLLLNICRVSTYHSKKRGGPTKFTSTKTRVLKTYKMISLFLNKQLCTDRYCNQARNRALVTRCHVQLKVLSLNLHNSYC